MSSNLVQDTIKKRVCIYATLFIFYKFMENYYTEIIEEITSLIQDEKFEEADVLLKRELQMPYVPGDVEEKLRALKKDIQYARSEKSQNKELSIDTLLSQLHGSAESQLSAVESLCKRNLREYIEEVQDYLAHEPNTEAASLLIDAIAQQEIGDEFTYCKEGIEYTFWGDAVTPVAKCEGLLEALRYLYEWLGVKYPSLYEMGKKMLVHKVYVSLPLTYEKEEGMYLAYDVCENLLVMMDENELLETIRRKLKKPLLS